jgi:putative transposase
MPRTPRADEAGGLYHALNRGNSRAAIFRKEADYDAFEQILGEGLERYDVQLFCYQLMPNHWHLVLRPTQDGEMSRFLRWVTATHTMRYHAHYHTSGTGHVYQGRFKSFPIQDDAHFLTVCRYVERNALRAELTTRAEDWRWGSLWRWKQSVEPIPALLSPWPIPRSPNWVARVNAALPDRELSALRRSAQRGSPFGDTAWIEASAQRLGLTPTINPRGRPRVRFSDNPENHES